MTRKFSGTFEFSLDDNRDAEQMGKELREIIGNYLNITNLKWALEEEMSQLTATEERNRGEIVENIKKAHSEACAAIGCYNKIVIKLDDWLTTTRSRLEKVYDKKSDRWKESKQGVALESLMEALECVRINEMDTPDDLNVSDIDTRLTASEDADDDD